MIKCGFANDTRICRKCGRTFNTNYYGHQSICYKCEQKQNIIKFFKSPIKETIKKIINWANS